MKEPKYPKSLTLSLYGNRRRGDERIKEGGRNILKKMKEPKPHKSLIPCLYGGREEERKKWSEYTNFLVFPATFPYHLLSCPSISLHPKHNLK
jgi:hypothetical protein